jgi:hypothetical protein
MTKWLSIFNNSRPKFLDKSATVHDILLEVTNKRILTLRKWLENAIPGIWCPWTLSLHTLRSALVMEEW